MLRAFLFSLMLFSSKIALAGGADGGGGDIPQSSERDVRKAVEAVFKLRLPDAFYNLAYAMDQVKDPYIKRILYSFYDRPAMGGDWEEHQPILGDLKNTAYRLEERASCIEPSGKEHAAGVAQLKLGETICLSIPKLRLLPKEDLEFEILALLAHEFAHHFGFGEHEATKFQTFFRHGGKDLASFPQHLHFKLPALTIQAMSGETTWPGKVSIQKGELLKDAPPLMSEVKEPVCTLHLAYDRDSFDQFQRKKEFTGFSSAETVLELDPISNATHCKSGQFCKTTSITFHINQVWRGSSYESTGSPLARIDGKPSSNRIQSMTCEGQSLRVMDLKRAFGPKSDVPYLIQ